MALQPQVTQLDGGQTVYYGTAAPIASDDIIAKLGDIVLNTTPTASGTAAWMCTVAGNPGTWKAVALGA